MSEKIENIPIKFDIDTSEIDSALEKIMSKAEGIGEKLKNAFAGIDFNSLISLATLLQPLLEGSGGAAAGASAGIAAVIAQVAAVVAALTVYVSSLYLLYSTNEEFASKVDELWKNVKTNFISIWESIKAIFEPIILSIKDFWDENGEEIVTSFMERFEAIANFISQIGIEISDIFNTIAEMFTENGTVITEALTATWDIIWSIISVAFDTITGIIDILTALLQGDFLGVWNALVDTVGNAFIGLGEAFISFYELIKVFTDEIIAVLVGVYDNIVDFFVNFEENITSFFETLPDKMKEYGKNIIQGLIDGIKQMIDKVVEVAKEVGSAISDKIKSVLGINSPSKVMIGFGVNTGEGFALGLKKTFGDIKEAAGTMASVITTSVSGLATGESGTYYNRKQTNNFSSTLNVNSDIDNLKYIVEVNRLLRKQAALIM